MKFIPLENRLRDVLAEKLSDLNASACGPLRERVLNFVEKLKQEDKQAPAMAFSLYFSHSLQQQQKLKNFALIGIPSYPQSLIFF